MTNKEKLEKALLWLNEVEGDFEFPASLQTATQEIERMIQFYDEAESLSVNNK